MADPSFRTALHRLDEAGLPEAWEALLARSIQATACADLHFGPVVLDALGLEPRIAAVWNGDVLAAGALVFEKSVGPLRAAALPPFVQYVSPLLAESLREADVHAHRSPLDALLALLAESYDQASLVLHPSLQDARPLQWAGWDLKPAYTYRLTLGESPTTGWSSNPKRTLKSEAAHFTVEIGEEGVDAVADLVLASHERQGQDIGVVPEALWRMVHGATEAGLARIFVARRDGTPEAGLAALTDGRTAHYWLAGSIPGPAMTVLLAEAFTQLRAEGVTTFDFAGANTPSIAEFKRRFGAELVPYFRARHTRPGPLRLLDPLRPL